MAQLTTELQSYSQEQQEQIKFVRQCVGYEMSCDECLERFELYLSYRAEGQTHEVSKQYAGM